jgi:hypothetical protein
MRRAFVAPRPLGAPTAPPAPAAPAPAATQENEDAVPITAASKPSAAVTVASCTAATPAYAATYEAADSAPVAPQLFAATAGSPARAPLAPSRQGVGLDVHAPAASSTHGIVAPSGRAGSTGSGFCAPKPLTSSGAVPGHHASFAAGGAGVAAVGAPDAVYYAVFYTKQSNKKHKTYDEGIVSLDGKTAVLYDMEGASWRAMCSCGDKPPVGSTG